MAALSPAESFCFLLAPFTDTPRVKEVCGGKSHLSGLFCFPSLSLTFSLVVYFLLDIWQMII